MKLFQMLLARVDDERVDLDHHNFLDARVPQDFTQYETVASAFDQDTLRSRVKQKRWQRDGFVVDELIDFEELDDGVEKEPFAELGNARDRDFLRLRPLAIDPLLDPEKDVPPALELVQRCRGPILGHPCARHRASVPIPRAPVAAFRHR